MSQDYPRSRAAFEQCLDGEITGEMLAETIRREVSEIGRAAAIRNASELVRQGGVFSRRGPDRYPIDGPRARRIR